MSLSPGIIAQITAEAASMTPQQRASRAAKLIDIPRPIEEVTMEFTKLVCGPDAGVEEFAALICGSGPSEDRAA